MSLGAHAHFNTFGLTSGGHVSRYQLTITCVGESSKVETNGVNLINGKQHADTTLFMDHAVPHCASREIFRAVVDDRAHSVFQGRIIVRPDAQKTDAKMMTRALLLSDDAEADNKPELEIFADDVTCGHGATTGALDESLLFYMRARGLPEKEAQALLIQAFVGEAIETIASDALREVAIATAQRWLQARAMSMHKAVAQRYLRRRAGARRISRRWPCRSTASRWSISTTRPRRRSRMRCSTA